MTNSMLWKITVLWYEERTLLFGCILYTHLHICFEPKHYKSIRKMNQIILSLSRMSLHSFL